MNNDLLKFRVWDKKHRTYEHDSAGAYFIDMRGDLIFIKEEDDNADRVQGENFIVERCTGLRDRNNKLIYEADVFEAYVLNSFDGDKFIGQKICGTVAYYPDEACFTFAAYGPMNLGNLEIIGTIHDDQFRDNTKFIEEKE